MSKARWLFPAVALCLFSFSSISHAAQLLSLDFTGTRSGQSGVSESFAISADGRFAAFSGSSTNYVANDTNGMNDLYVHDCVLRKHVWDTTFGFAFPFAGGTPGSTPWAFSPDGRYLAFVSAATNLVSGFAFSLGNSYQLYVRDLLSNVTTLVSVAHDGTNIADRPFVSSLRKARIFSADGRFISFSSSSTNLAALRDVNFGSDIFCRDLVAGTTELITLAPSGDRTLDREIGSFLVSTNARFFAFDTSATNVVIGMSPTNHFTQIYWRDRLAGTNALVTITWDGGFAFSGGTLRDMSSDGRFVCFQSLGTNLVANQNDNGSTWDIFIRDMFLGETWLVSRTTNGTANGDADGGQFSANGQVLIFSSDLANLVPGITDANGITSDIFAHYLQSRTNAIVSASWQGNTGASWYASDLFANISASGRFVLFTSTATNLIRGSTNQLQRLYLRDLQSGLTLNPLRSPYFPTPSFNYAHTAISETERYIFFMAQDNLDPSVTDTNLKNIDLFRAALYQPKFLSVSLADALPNTTYVLEFSSDLHNWSPFFTNASDAQGRLSYDLNRPPRNTRFHRLLWP